ncbi:MAG: hypothetical protein BRC29_01225 [Nanohaloarchaea archaeon SW_7_43_1]|nr:MAG: hypothetical protein BRC29_01225 [Nanohaloarchaea archaeon SW_7_43_1]
MKGQYVGMLTVFVLVFIITGNVFGALLFQNEYKEEIDFSIGNYNTIAEAQVIGERYIPRIETETNYSSNIMAFRIGMNKGEYEGLEDYDDPEGDLSWGYNTPRYSELREEFRKATRDHLKTQNEVFNCRNPMVETLQVEKEPLSVKTTFKNNWINCTSSGAEASIKIPEEASSVHEKNRYLQMAKYSVEFSGRLSDHIDDYWDNNGPITNDGYENGRCGVGEGTVEENAEIDAEKDIPDTKNVYGKILFKNDEGNRPEWVSLKDQNTTFTSSTIKSSRITDTSSCCQNYKTNDEGETSCADSDNSHEAEATAAATEVKINFTIKDSERTVVDSEGAERSINFKFKKIEDVPDSYN